MKKKSPALLLDPREVNDLIVKVLSRNRLGLPADKIRKDLPPSHRISTDQLSACLAALLQEGRIFAWPFSPETGIKAPAPVYSVGPLDTLVSDDIRLRLSHGPLSLGEIKKSFPPHINKNLPIFLDPLLRDRIVKWHPPLKGKRLGLEDPDPAFFLSAEIRRLLQKGERLGFPREAIMKAVQGQVKPVPSPIAPPPNALETERIVFQAMKTLKPTAAQGSLVFLPDLRKALKDSFPDKDSFDRAILTLARQEKIQLQSHSLPAELTQEQRRDMIDNGRGSFFMAAGIRME